MTAGPGDLGDTRTLQDPLAEALRIVDLAEQRGPARPADGRDGDPGPRPGLARTDPSGRGRPRLRDARQGPRRVLRAARARGLHPGQAAQRAVRRQAGVLRRRAAQPAGRRARRQPRDVPSLRVRGPARRVDARRCRSPSCCCRSCRSSRSTARTCSTRWSCSPSTRSRQDDGAADARPRARARSTCRASCRSPRTTGAGGGR